MLIADVDGKSPAGIGGRPATRWAARRRLPRERPGSKSGSGRYPSTPKTLRHRRRRLVLRARTPSPTRDRAGHVLLRGPASAAGRRGGRPCTFGPHAPVGGPRPDAAGRPAEARRGAHARRGCRAHGGVADVRGCADRVEIRSDEELPLGKRLARGHDATLSAIREGVAAIYQAVLFDGRRLGYTDFLRRVEQRSNLGP